MAESPEKLTAGHLIRTKSEGQRIATILAHDCLIAKLDGEDVEAGSVPGTEHSTSMDPREREEFLRRVRP